MDVLSRDCHLFELVPPMFGQTRNRGFDQLFGCRRSGRDPDRRVTVEELDVQLALAVDQLGPGARVARDFDETLRIGARLRADHENQRRLLGESLDGVLAILRRVANVIGGGAPEVTESLLERIDGAAHGAESQAGLRDDRYRFASGVESLRVLRGLDHDRSARSLAARADHLHVVRVSDERDEVAGVRIAPCLGMYLRHERANRVDDAQSPALAVLPYNGRDAMRGENADLAGGHFVLGVDEDRSHPLEPAYDVVVVDDLVPHIDRRAVLPEEPLDDLDCTIDPRAERARRCQEDAFMHAPTSVSPPSARRARACRRARPA